MIPIASAWLFTPKQFTNVLSKDIYKRVDYISVTWNRIARSAFNLLSLRITLRGFMVKLFMYFNKTFQQWVDEEKKT